MIRTARLFLATLLLLGATFVLAEGPAVFQDSSQTREEMMRVLRGYPPEAGVVLKLDPTLLGNKEYMANYPALAAWVASHPDVAHNPRFFLDQISVRGEYVPDPPSVRIWTRMMEGVGMFFFVMTFLGAFIWLVKTLGEQRRWSRVTRMQNETMTKLLDRFGSNEELMAYLQSPGGRLLFEAGAVPMEPARRLLSAPMSRIFWSLQAGLVASAIGVGLQLVSFRVPPEIDPPLFAMGTVMLSIGIGFILSAIVSYVLSKRLGLWPPAPAPAAE